MKDPIIPKRESVNLPHDGKDDKLLTAWDEPTFFGKIKCVLGHKTVKTFDNFKEAMLDAWAVDQCTRCGAKRIWHIWKGFSNYWYGEIPNELRFRRI